MPLEGSNWGIFVAFCNSKHYMYLLEIGWMKYGSICMYCVGDSYADGTSTVLTWWRHQMETLSALLALCAGNSPFPYEFLAQRPVTRSFYVYFDLRLNKRLCKQSWGWWFETLLCPLWRHSNDKDLPVNLFSYYPRIFSMTFCHCQ